MKNAFIIAGIALVVAVVGYLLYMQIEQQKKNKVIDAVTGGIIEGATEGFENF